MPVSQMFINRAKEWKHFVQANPNLGLTEEQGDLDFLKRFMDIEIHDAGGVIPFEVHGLLQGLPFYYRERGGASLRVAGAYQTTTTPLVEDDWFPEDRAIRKRSTPPIVERVVYPWDVKEATLYADVDYRLPGDGWSDYGWEWIERFIEAVEALRPNRIYAWGYNRPDSQTSNDEEHVFLLQSETEAGAREMIEKYENWDAISQRLLFHKDYSYIIEPIAVEPIKVMGLDDFRDEMGKVRFNY